MGKFLDAGSSGQYGWHATEIALRCPQLFAYHYRCGSGARLAGERHALIRGSLVHAGLAHHYIRMQNWQNGSDPNEWATPEAAIIDCADKLRAEGEVSAMEYVPAATAIVAAYQQHYATEKLTILSVEEVFTSEIGGHKFTQRFDLVAQRPDGKVYIFDHKTTGFLSSKLPERYTLSGQFLGMANFGQRLYGTDFGGVVINLIACGAAYELAPPTKIDFSREPPNPAPQSQRLFSLSVLHARERIEQLDRSGLDPWNWPKTLSEQVCVTAYGKCEGYELCRWGES